MQHLPFKFNLGDSCLNKEQQDQLLNLIYEHKEVFSLHDEDVGFCDKLAYTIVTMTDKPVYLLYWTIPKQLQVEVRKCLDTWLKQGIICPSKAHMLPKLLLLGKRLVRFDSALIVIS